MGSKRPAAAPAEGEPSPKKAKAAADPAPAPASALTVFMKRDGPGYKFFEVAARADMSISALLKVGMAELPSLQGTDRDALSLHLVKDTDGTELEPALDTRKTLAAEGVKHGASLVIQQAQSKQEAGECVERGFMKRSWPCSLRPASLACPPLALMFPSPLHCADRTGWLRAWAAGVKPLIAAAQAAAAEPATTATAAEPSSSIIVLGKGLCWPGVSSDVLYVRACYEPLWRSVLGECKRPKDATMKQFGAVILGTPGSE